MQLTNGQQLALEQLYEIEAYGNQALEIIQVEQKEKKFRIEISIDCTGYKKINNGLPLRSRERFIIILPEDFPFELPRIVTKHTRFAGFPHVQWKRLLCLYISPSTEWEPSDGIFGYMDRLHDWLRQGALNQLDPSGAPSHPPITYPSSKNIKTIIPRVNTPEVLENGWYGTAHLKRISEDRLDVVGWSSLFAKDTPKNVSAAILTSKYFPFEFPETVSNLIAELEHNGVSFGKLALTLYHASLYNQKDSPLLLIIGTPMRGIQGEARKQHLVAWYIAKNLVRAFKLSTDKYSDDIRKQKIGKEVEKIIRNWSKKAKVEWCRVREDRSEVIIKRDHSSPISWFKNRSVALWGCGALGSHIAEYLTRAGVRKIVLIDNGIVTPGIMVRQLYNDIDIGKYKIDALEDRLIKIQARQDVEFEKKNCDLIELLNDDEIFKGVDIIVNTTASRVIEKKLEFRRRFLSHSKRVPIISMMVGHLAQCGIVTISMPQYSGSNFDLFRKTKISTLKNSAYFHFADEFWPEKPRQELFQPEPGCSDATFLGSDADVSALSACMINYAVRSIKNDEEFKAFSFLLMRPDHCLYENNTDEKCLFKWKSDKVIEEAIEGYEVRIKEQAWNKICNYILKSRKKNNVYVETGGILFGQRDDVLKIIWIDEILGPPSDSLLSKRLFICGISGVKEKNEALSIETREAVQFIGVWHTHPNLPTQPSEIDINGMAKIVIESAPSTSKALLLIIGEDLANPQIGAYLFKKSDFRIIGIPQKKTVIFLVKSFYNRLRLSINELTTRE